MERFVSSKIPIFRGVSQDCPLSQLLFNLVIEVLAIAVRNNSQIQRIQVEDIQHKLAIYADVFFFTATISIIT